MKRIAGVAVSVVNTAAVRAEVEKGKAVGCSGVVGVESGTDGAVGGSDDDEPTRAEPAVAEAEVEEWPWPSHRRSALWGAETRLCSGTYWQKFRLENGADCHWRRQRRRRTAANGTVKGTEKGRETWQRASLLEAFLVIMRGSHSEWGSYSERVYYRKGQSGVVGVHT